MSADLVRPLDSSNPATADPAPAASTPVDAPPPTPASNPMQQNATKCTIPEKIKDLTTQPAQLNTPVVAQPPAATTTARPLSARQELALDMILAAYNDADICSRLRIDRSTLYRWKYHHPLFVGELNRRQQHLWNDVALDLRVALTRAVKAIQTQLLSLNDTTQLRAARALLHLVNADRLSPAGAPTNLKDVLDHLLQQQSQSQPASDAQTPTFTDAQRDALLNQFLAEDAAAQAREDAQSQARRAAAAQRRLAPTNSPANSEAPAD
jgi:hypothetical protein